MIIKKTMMRPVALADTSGAFAALAENTIVIVPRPKRLAQRVTVAFGKRVVLHPQIPWQVWLMLIL